MGRAVGVGGRESSPLPRTPQELALLGLGAVRRDAERSSTVAGHSREEREGRRALSPHVPAPARPPALRPARAELGHSRCHAPGAGPGEPEDRELRGPGGDRRGTGV